MTEIIIRLTDEQEALLRHRWLTTEQTSLYRQTISDITRQIRDALALYNQLRRRSQTRRAMTHDDLLNTARGLATELGTAIGLIQALTPHCTNQRCTDVALDFLARHLEIVVDQP